LAVFFPFCFLKQSDELLLGKYSHILLFNPSLTVVSVNLLGNAVIDNEENAKLCLCHGCPTYKKSNMAGNVFCARGKAKEKIASNGCMCPNCSVFKNYSLDQMYFCSKGKSLDIKA